jgi:hypothetical protein
MIRRGPRYSDLDLDLELDQRLRAVGNNRGRGRVSRGMRTCAIVVLALTWAGTGSAAPTRSAPIGTAHPIRIDEHAPDGSWLIACQARKDTDGKPGLVVEVDLHGHRGDTLAPYLIWGSGAGTPIDAFANQTPDGRWLAVVRDGKLELHDAKARTSVVLAGANTEDDGASEQTSRVTSFAAAGNRMVYFRKSRDRDLVVIRELATGAEHVVDIPGLVWRADVDRAGRWAKLRVMRADTDGDGQIDWAFRNGWIGLRSCFQRDPHMRHTMGDTPVTVWLDLVSGAIVEDPTIVHALGDRLLRVRADHAITLDGAELVPAACHAKILALAVSPPRVVVACGKPGVETGTVGIFGPKLAVATTQPTKYDDPLFGPHLVDGAHVCPRHADWCVELATGKITRLPGKSVSVWGHHGELAFVLDHDREISYVWDPAAGAQRPFTAPRDSFPDVHGALVIIGELEADRYDWVRNKRIGKADEYIYGHDTAGRVLVGRKSADNRRAPGPLYWEAR